MGVTEEIKVVEWLKTQIKILREELADLLEKGEEIIELEVDNWKIEEYMQEPEPGFFCRKPRKVITIKPDPFKLSFKLKVPFLPGWKATEREIERLRHDMAEAGFRTDRIPFYGPIDDYDEVGWLVRELVNLRCEANWKCFLIKFSEEGKRKAEKVRRILHRKYNSLPEEPLRVIVEVASYGDFWCAPRAAVSDSFSKDAFGSEV